MRQRFGTVLATRTGAHARIKGAAQRSGKTYTAVAALSDGETIFVQNAGMIRHVEACLRAQGRSKSAINIVMQGA